MNENRFNPLGVGMGSRIADRYEIAKMIGAGSMSAVYKAYDKALNNQPCALKILSSVLTNDEIDLERFRSEVMITRTLTHEGIIRTFEFGRAENGLYFIAMEYLEGINLEQLISRSAQESLPLSDILGILRSIAVPLAYAHDRKVIHRDIKPANVLIGSNGEVKLADFGLAKTSDFQMKLTQAGESVGSPAYMSPEQMKGKQVDHRTDIYALGVIAFQMAARRLPFESSSPYELGAMVCKEEFPKLKDVNASVPPWFSQFVEKACAYDPQDRFQSAEEIIAIIDQHAADAQGKMLIPTVSGPGAQAVFKSMFSGLDFGLLRVAPLMTFVCLMAFVAMIIAGTTERPVQEVEAKISKSSDIIKDLTHSVKELTEVAVEAHKRRDEIRAFIEEQSIDENGADPEAAMAELEGEDAKEPVEGKNAAKEKEDAEENVEKDLVKEVEDQVEDEKIQAPEELLQEENPTLTPE